MHDNLPFILYVLAIHGPFSIATVAGKRIILYINFTLTSSSSIIDTNLEKTMHANNVNVVSLVTICVIELFLENLYSTCS